MRLTRCSLVVPILAFAISVSFAQNSDAFFKRFDKDGDGKLSREEFPQRARRLFDRIDKDKDGFVTMAEYRAFRQSRRQRPQTQRPKLPTSDHANVAYGEGSRNVLDLWLAKSEKPTPLVIYYHGGGFRGGSAGAGISMWLALHDDLAAPDSEDPVARESTRLTCAVVYAAQSSYDPRFIKKLFNTNQVDAALIPFFGMKDAADVDDPKFWPLFEEASVINHATPDDPPIMAFYPQPNQPLPPNSPGGQHIHHPKFGEVLKQKLDEVGVECVVKFREDYPQPLPAKGGPVDDYVKFFVEKLLPKPE